MKFLKRLSERLFGSANGELQDPNGIYLYIKCNKCGAPVRLRIDKRNDLMRDYDTGMLTLNKEIMDGTCFSLMYANVVFDGAYQMVSQEITGGEFIDWETYKAMTAPKETPPTEATE